MEKVIALYMRLSQEDVDKRTNAVKDESNSIGSQRLLIHQHLDGCADLRDWPRMEFCDDGFTGTHFDRPEFSRMMEKVRHGEIGCIVVKDLSRFGRDYLEVGDYLEHLFPFLGVRFKSVNDDYDSDRHRGRTLGLDVAFKNLVYDYYSKDLSQKVKSAMGMRQKVCHFVTSAPYGYRVLPQDKHHLVIDPQTAPVVRRIYQQIIAGKSSTQIARELNGEGIPTPAQSKRIQRKSASCKPQWTHRTVLSLIENIKYTGTMVNHTHESRHIRDKNQRRVPQNEWYVKENAHEAIVSQEEYDAAMQAIHRRKRTEHLEHDCSDRVYVCGHCGAKLEKANGTVFACPSHRYHADSPCAGVRVKKAELEAVLLAALRHQVFIARMDRRERNDTCQTPVEQLQGRLEALRIQIEMCGRKKLMHYEAYRAGQLTVDAYKARRTALAMQQEELEAERTQCDAVLQQAKCAQEEQKESCGGLEQWTGMREAQLCEHLYDAVEQVKVYDREDMEIVWKFEAPDKNQADQANA